MAFPGSYLEGRAEERAFSITLNWRKNFTAFCTIVCGSNHQSCSSVLVTRPVLST
eukprot:XP_001709998.1 Hypothetical protein GL50803_34977 [Giardia lamblia ATCC 50803]